MMKMAIHLKSTPNENKNKSDMRLSKMETNFKGQKLFLFYSFIFMTKFIEVIKKITDWLATIKTSTSITKEAATTTKMPVAATTTTTTT